MKFFIEQIAICPKDPADAAPLLMEIGAKQWHLDEVRAKGTVFGEEGENKANLAFNYELGPGPGKPLEFEVLHYETGPNWIEASQMGEAIQSHATYRPQSVVSHLGMHCSYAELLEWKLFFYNRGIRIAQEVNTLSHTNPAIAGKRQYTYCIFDTRGILGVDLKFIVRQEVGRQE